MKKIMIIALATTLSFAGITGAAKNENKPLRGKITEIKKDAANPKAVELVIATGGKKNPQSVTVKADDTTKVTVDGAAAKLADLTEGERVSISPSTGSPVTIEALTKGHRKNAAPVAAAPVAPATQPAAKP